MAEAAALEEESSFGVGRFGCGGDQWDGLGGGALLGPGRPVPALELGLGFDRSGLVRPQTLHQPSPV